MRPETTTWISIAGLCLDIFGALFLTKSIILKRDNEINEESAMYWGHNLHLSNSLIQQKLEAKIGAIFLALGFTGQMLGYLFQMDKGVPLFVGAVSCGVAILIWVTISNCARKYAKHKMFKIDLETILEKEFEPNRKNPAFITEHAYNWGMRLGIFGKEGESDEAYVKRVEDELASYDDFIIGGVRIGTNLINGGKIAIYALGIGALSLFLTALGLLITKL